MSLIGETAQEEREAIISYLQKVQDAFQERINKGEQPRVSGYHKEACRLISLNIECGEHWQPEWRI